MLSGRQHYAHQVWRHVVYRKRVPSTWRVTWVIRCWTEGASPIRMVSDFYEEVFGSVQVLKQNRIKLATSFPCQVEFCLDYNSSTLRTLTSYCSWKVLRETLKSCVTEFRQIQTSRTGHQVERRFQYIEKRSEWHSNDTIWRGWIK